MTHQNIDLPEDPRFYPLSIAVLHAAEGDGIEAGQPVFDLVDSSGNSFTIRAQNRGRLLRILFRTGETISEPGHRVVEYALTEPAGRVPETRLQIFGIALDRRAGAYPIRIGGIRVKAGDDIAKGTPLWDYEDRNGTALTAYAPQQGKIFGLRVAPGDIFTEPGHAGMNYVPLDVPAADATPPAADRPTAPAGAPDWQIRTLCLSRQADHYPIRIRDVFVKPGADFAAGDRLWQMENRTGTLVWGEAPSAGRAAAVRVSPGDIFTEPGMHGIDYIRMEPVAASRPATAKAPSRPASPATPRRPAMSTDLGAFDKMPDGRYVFVVRHQKRFVAGLAFATVLICGAAILGETGYNRLTDSFRALTNPISFSSGGQAITKPESRSAADIAEKADLDRAKNDLDRVLAASGPGQTSPNPQQQANFTAWIDG